MEKPMSFEGRYIAFADEGKLSVVIDDEYLSVIDLEKQEVLKKTTLPLRVWGYDGEPIKIIQDKNFALITLEKNQESKFIIFDIKKQKLVGKNLKFIDSKRNKIEKPYIFIVPEEKKEIEEFFNFQNFDLDINYEKNNKKRKFDE
jgi:hypothetical protein